MKSLSEQITPVVQRQVEEEEEEEPLMTKSISSGTQQVRDNLHARLNRNRGGGQPLPEADRNFMQRRFGVDFSRVKVHTDSNAAQMSRELNAQAFSHGRDIYFGAGRYSPSTSPGKRLLAHELSHVVQQTGTKLSPVIQRQGEGGPAAQPGPGSGGPDMPPPDVPIPGEQEPNCPGRTNLGYREPFPPCPHTDEEIDGDVYLFCTDSDIFKTPSERTQLRTQAQQQPHGTTFKVHAHSSIEGPGTTEQSRQYNERLSCHRAKRAARELMAVGVTEENITIESKGPTDMFGKGYALRHLNRNVVVAMEPQQRRREALPQNATLRQIADAARARLVRGDYNLGADGYIYRWTCGRFQALKDAVARTTVKVEGTDFQISISNPVARPWLGSIGRSGLNTIRLSNDIEADVDPVGCAASRIVDLTFHHMARPLLPLHREQHQGGTHMVFLGGLPGCTTGPIASVPNQNYYQPLANDPKAGRQPHCADTPGGPISPQRQPGRLVQAPVFQGIRIVPNVGSGNLNMVNQVGPTVILEPSQAIRLDGQAVGLGDPTELAKYEVGFLQTVLKEDYLATYVGGHRLRDRLPLPLKDGAPPGDARYAAPWLDNRSRVTARQGPIVVSMTDIPNIRVFKVFPNLEATRFVFNVTPPGGSQHQFTMPHTRRRGVVQQGFAADSPYNVPAKAHREIHFNTWLAARQAVPRTPLTRMSTDFLIGIRMVLRMDADFIERNGVYTGRGTWRLTSGPATPADESSMLLRGAVPLQFKTPQGVPMFNEYLISEGPVPRAQAGGIPWNAYWREVRRIAQPHRTTAAQRGSLTVNIRIENATGRVILDSSTLQNNAITVEGRDGNRIPANEARQLAWAIFPEVRKLVLGYIRLSLPPTGISRLPVILRRMP